MRYYRDITTLTVAIVRRDRCRILKDVTHPHLKKNRRIAERNINPLVSKKLRNEDEVYGLRGPSFINTYVQSSKVVHCVQYPFLIQAN